MPYSYADHQRIGELHRICIVSSFNPLRMRLTAGHAVTCAPDDRCGAALRRYAEKLRRPAPVRKAGNEHNPVGSWQTGRGGGSIAPLPFALNFIRLEDIPLEGKFSLKNTTFGAENPPILQNLEAHLRFCLPSVGNLQLSVENETSCPPFFLTHDAAEFVIAVTTNSQ